MTRPVPAPGRAPAAADLAWYGVLREIGQARPRWDLATGQPLHDPEIGAAVASALAAAAARPGIGARLATYRDLDGAPELRSAAAAMLSASLGRDVADGELLVVPGAQAALRSVQAVMRAARRRLLFPVGLEYPGAADPQAVLPPSAGAGRWSAGGTVIDLQPDLLDWDQVGAVIISRPHSPTGRIWPAGQMRRLRDDAACRGAWLVIDETFALPAMPVQAEPVQLVDGPGVVHLWSFSKAGLAAERLALVAARPEVIAVLRRELRASAIAASYLGQLLAAALLEAAARDGTGSRLGALYQQRWQALRGALAAALPGDAGAAVARWQGGPFLWLSWAGGPDDMAVFRELLRRGVGVTPGSTVHVTGEPVRAVRVGLDAPAGQIGQVGALIGAGLRAAAAGGRRPARHAARRPARSRTRTGVLESGGCRCRPRFTVPAAAWTGASGFRCQPAVDGDRAARAGRGAGPPPVHLHDAGRIQQIQPAEEPRHLVTGPQRRRHRGPPVEPAGHRHGLGQDVAGRVGQRQPAAGRHRGHQLPDDLIRAVPVLDQVQDPDQHHGDRAARVQGRRGLLEEQARVAQVGVEVSRRAVRPAGQQGAGVHQDQGVVVGVDDPAARRDPLGHLMSVIGSRQPGPDVEELPDPRRAGQVADRGGQERPLGAGPGGHARVGSGRFLAGDPVRLVVVLAAQPVVIDPGRVRRGRVDHRRRDRGLARGDLKPPDPVCHRSSRPPGPRRAGTGDPKPGRAPVPGRADQPGPARRAGPGRGNAGQCQQEDQ